MMKYEDIKPEDILILLSKRYRYRVIQLYNGPHFHGFMLERIDISSNIPLTLLAYQRSTIIEEFGFYN